MFQLQNYDPFPVNEKRLSQGRRIWNSKPEGWRILQVGL
jgi:hypothetical protein